MCLVFFPRMQFTPYINQSMYVQRHVYKSRCVSFLFVLVVSTLWSIIMLKSPAHITIPSDSKAMTENNDLKNCLVLSRGALINVTISSCSFPFTIIYRPSESLISFRHSKLVEFCISIATPLLLLCLQLL